MTSRITEVPHTFDLITVPNRDGGEDTYPFEYTPSPHLVIICGAIDEQGRPGFGYWRITHVPSGAYLPVPEPHSSNIETTRWIAHELAKADIDWLAPTDTFPVTVAPKLRELIRQADEEDQANTPAGELSHSMLRRIVDANARIDAKVADRG
jgi:hypothetical protein